jgi:hypothetical protein
VDLEKIVADLKAERDRLTRAITVLEGTDTESAPGPRPVRTAKRPTTTTPGAMGTTLEQARQRFESWRKARPRASRIPKALWAMAVKTARTEGVNKAATSLQLNYNALKKRVNLAAEPTSSPVKSVGRSRAKLRSRKPSSTEKR